MIMKVAEWCIGEWKRKDGFLLEIALYTKERQLVVRALIIRSVEADVAADAKFCFTKYKIVKEAD